MNDEIAALKAALPKLSQRSQEFANSLLKQAEQYNGVLSEKQMFWVRKLVQDNNQPKPTVDLGDFSGVINLFDGAARNLKRPKVRLQLKDGRPVVLSIAGQASRFPGTVNVTDGSGFDTSIWYGRVNLDGKFDMSSKVDATTAACLTALLINFANNPAKIASDYGVTTGSCCFCAKTLTDPRSKFVGYGPICADKFGLPWGGVN
jgi:Family of unknown function (DUF6011)